MPRTPQQIELCRRTLAGLNDKALDRQALSAMDHDDDEFLALVEAEVDAREADRQQYGPVA